MKHFFLSLILGFYLMICLEDMTMAVDIPAPIFIEPGDTTVPTKKFNAPSEHDNILTCASSALSGKFPFDFMGVFQASSPASAACPRIVFFEGTPSPISFEMCFVLNTISLLKYPLLIGLSVSVIMAL